MKRVEDLMTFVKERPCRIEEYDESLVRQFLEKIIVYDDHFTVYFKSGMEIMIE